MTADTWAVFGGVIAIVGVIFQMRDVLKEIYSIKGGNREIHGTELLVTLIALGLIASAVQGVLWALIEANQGWNFGAGGGKEMPTGIQAVVLSLTITIPLCGIPTIYQARSRKRILPDHHLLRSCCVILSMAGAHVLMYGTASPKIKGLKELIYPVGEDVALPTAIWTEAVYGFVYFSAVVLVYQCIFGVRGRLKNISAKYLLSMSMWITGLAAFLCLKYPASIRDPRWVEVRGVLSALWLQLTLLWGMLL